MWVGQANKELHKRTIIPSPSRKREMMHEHTRVFISRQSPSWRTLTDAMTCLCSKFLAVYTLDSGQFPVISIILTSNVPLV